MAAPEGRTNLPQVTIALGDVPVELASLSFLGDSNIKDFTFRVDSQPGQRSTGTTITFAPGTTATTITISNMRPENPDDLMLYKIELRGCFKRGEI